MTMTVLITGASSGIGEGLAREYARRGARLALVARRLERLEALANELRAAGAEVSVHVGDVTIEGDIARVVKELIRVALPLILYMRMRVTASPGPCRV